MDKKYKRILTWILMTVAVCIISFLFYRETVLNQLSNVLYGQGTTEFYLLSATNDGELWALGRQNDGAYILSEGNNGKSSWWSEMDTSALPERFLIEQLFAVSETEALLEVCTIDEAGMCDARQLFRISEKGSRLTPLISVSCTGNTHEERQASVVFSSFSLQENMVCFVLWRNGTAYSYEISLDTWELRMARYFQCDSFKDAIVFPTGEIGVINSDGDISIYILVGSINSVLRTGASIAKVYSGGDGLFYLDSADGTLNQVMRKDGEFYLVQKIPVDMYTVMTVQENGTIYYIWDGRLYENTGAEKDITNVLYGPRTLSCLKLVLWILICISIAYLIALFMNGKRHVSILAKAALYVVMSLIALIGSTQAFLLPMQEEELLQIARQNLETTTGMGLRMTEEAVDGAIINHPANHTWKALSDAGFYDSSVTLYQYVDRGFTVLDTTSDTVEKGSKIEGGTPVLNAAPPSGTISEIKETLNGPVCSCLSTDGKLLLEVNANLSGIQANSNKSGQSFMKVSLGTDCLLLLLSFFLVFSVWLSLKNISRGVYAVTEGNYDVVIKNSSSDELESLATAINNLTLILKGNQAEMDTMAEWYRSFLPRGLFSLLSSGENGPVGLNSFASYDFLLLSVFAWKADVLNNPLNTEETMEELHQLLSEFIRITEEHNAITVTVGTKGSVFAFEPGRLSSALDQAVAFREALDIMNTQRAEKGVGPIILKMVLDFGKTDIGIIGVPEQKIVTALTDRKHHIDQLRRLEMIMGVTMIVTGAALEHGKADDCRYLGTYAFKDGIEKVYEVFSGDEFLLARRKRETMEEFSRGDETFYRKNYTEAKRIFMDLVRSGSEKDGAVLYYLNLSDYYENHPAEEIGLQCGMSVPTVNLGQKGLS